MHPALQSIAGSRSPALQQYDEARRNSAALPAGSSACSTPASRSKTGPGTAAAAATKGPADGAGTPSGDTWVLCGWEEEPSVPPAARAASAKLTRVKSAVQQPAPGSPKLSKCNSNSSTSSSKSTKRSGVTHSPSGSRHTTLGGAANTHGKPTKSPTKRGLKPLGRLGEESDGDSGEQHYRPNAPPAASPASAAAEQAVATSLFQVYCQDADRTAAAAASTACKQQEQQGVSSRAREVSSSASSSTNGSRNGSRSSSMLPAADGNAVMPSQSSGPVAANGEQQRQQQQHEEDTLSTVAAAMDIPSSTMRRSHSSSGRRSSNSSDGLPGPDRTHFQAGETCQQYACRIAVAASSGCEIGEYLQTSAPASGAPSAAVGSGPAHFDQSLAALQKSTSSSGTYQSSNTELIYEGSCPTVTGRSLPHPSLTNNIRSTIISLQQRLLLSRPADALGSSSGSSSNSTPSRRAGTGLLSAGRTASGNNSRSPLLRSSSLLTPTGSGTTSPSAAPSAATLTAAVAAAGGSSLHTRMATTAARAQMLLMRDLTSLATPHTPRIRSPAGSPGPPETPTATAAAAASRQQFADTGTAVAAAACGGGGGSSERATLGLLTEDCAQEQFQQSPGVSLALTAPTAAGFSPCLLDISSLLGSTHGSRPSSANRPQKPSAAAAAAAGAPANGCSPAAPASAVQLDGGSSSQGRQAAASSRPNSAAVSLQAQACSSSGGSGIVCDCRPTSAASSRSQGHKAGPSSGQPSSQGLAAAAEYQVSRTTLTDLLQRINSHKARAGLSSAAGDTLSSRDGSASLVARLPGTVLQDACKASKQTATDPGNAAAMGLERTESLKAYEAFKASPAAVGSPQGVLRSGSRTTFALTSSNASLSSKGVGVLRKCNSSKR